MKLNSVGHLTQRDSDSVVTEEKGIAGKNHHTLANLKSLGLRANITNNTSHLETKDMLSRVYTGDDLYVSINYHNVQLEY